MKKNHKAKKDIDTRIHRMCMMAGTDECQMEELGSTLLEVFHDVCRYNKEAANDMMADLCYHLDLCFEKGDEIAEMDTAVTRLEIFLSDARRDEYEREIESIQQAAGMLRIMDALRYRVYGFGKYGPEYVDTVSEWVRDKAPSPDDIAADDDAKERILRKAAKILTAKQLDAFQKICIERMTEKEYAKRVGISQPVTHRRVVAAKNKMKKFLK